MLHKGEGSVGCDFTTGRLPKEPNAFRNNERLPGSFILETKLRPFVWKTHYRVPRLVKFFESAFTQPQQQQEEAAAGKEKEVWIFGTAKSEAEKAAFFEAQARVPANVRFKYMRTFERMQTVGMHVILNDYAKIFGLTSKQHAMLTEYMRYWDILRQCCGRQMAHDWRVMLTSNATDPDAARMMPELQWKHSIHDPFYPACEMYDIVRVEERLLRSELLTKHANISEALFRVPRAPFRWHVLQGVQ